MQQAVARLTARGLLRECSRFGGPVIPVSASSVSFPGLLLSSHKHVQKNNQNSHQEQLLGPKRFHDSLVERVSAARRRIALSSLYIGNGALSAELVQALQKQVSKTQLSVDIVLDGRRARRGENRGKSSIDSLSGLLGVHRNGQDGSAMKMDNAGEGKGLRLSLYETPGMSPSHSFFGKLVPERLNEVFGVQHTKVVVVDDDVLLTGANLSETYFSDRLDRYIWIRNNPALADYCIDVVRTLQRFSSTVLAPGQVLAPEQSSTDTDAFADALHDLLRDHRRLNFDTSSSSGTSGAEHDTWIVPSLQAGFADVRVDERLCEFLMRSGFSSGQTPHRLTVSTPYLNLFNEFNDGLIYAKEQAREVVVVTSSPEANGFHSAKDISRIIPSLYAQATRRFFNEDNAWASVYGKDRMVDLRSWRRGSPPANYVYDRVETQQPNSDAQALAQKLSEFTSFHSKGLWIQPQGELPIATLIGSSNFSQRSVERDVEGQFLLVTENQQLREQLQDELHDACLSDSSPITKDTFNLPEYRKISKWWSPLAFRAAQTFL